ncbi:hypothetical protein ACVWWN_003905 [Mycobacterium sp. URHB0021]|jgi:hypothetical protein
MRLRHQDQRPTASGEISGVPLGGTNVGVAERKIGLHEKINAQLRSTSIADAHSELAQETDTCQAPVSNRSTPLRG